MTPTHPPDAITTPPDLQEVVSIPILQSFLNKLDGDDGNNAGEPKWLTWAIWITLPLDYLLACLITGDNKGPLTAITLIALKLFGVITASIAVGGIYYVINRFRSKSIVNLRYWITDFSLVVLLIWFGMSIVGTITTIVPLFQGIENNARNMLATGDVPGDTVDTLLMYLDHLGLTIPLGLIVFRKRWWRLLRDTRPELFGWLSAATIVLLMQTYFLIFLF